MKNIWIANYEGNEIKIFSHWFRGGIYFNGVLVDKKVRLLHFRLSGYAVGKDGRKLQIKANLFGPMAIDCMLYVNGRQVEVLSS